MELSLSNKELVLLFQKHFKYFTQDPGLADFSTFIYWLRGTHSTRTKTHPLDKTVPFYFYGYIQSTVCFILELSKYEFYNICIEIEREKHYGHET